MEVILASLITLLILGTMVHLVNAKITKEESVCLSRLSLVTGILNILAIIVLIMQLTTYRTETLPLVIEESTQSQPVPDLYDGDPLTIQVGNIEE